MKLLYADTGADSLSERILNCLRGLFACEYASFSLMDLRQAQWQSFSLSPIVSGWPSIEVYQRHLREDPAAAYIINSHDPSALKISDFVSLREFRNLGVYKEVFGRVGCDRRLGFAAQNPSVLTLAATVNRKGRDFSEEERTLLDLLRPHLLQANTQAFAHRTADNQRDLERTNLGEIFGAGLGEIDTDGRLLWLSARAQTLLQEFFPVKGHHRIVEQLPVELEEALAPTLRNEIAGPLHDPIKLKRITWHFTGPDQRRLKVRLVAGGTSKRWQLILEDTDAVAPARRLSQNLKLTRREAEILHWLKEGKTNWEIGAILGITAKTAGKHLENIFAKLKVENRTAAARIAVEASAYR